MAIIVGKSTGTVICKDDIQDIEFYFLFLQLSLFTYPCYHPVGAGTPATKAETPLVKKRQTKKKKNDSASKKDGKGGGSGGGEDGDESDGYEFVIVSYDNKV